MLDRDDMMMDRDDFEVYDGTSAPVTDSPAVTINRRGNFILNRAAFEALGKPFLVELLYGRASHIIGFRAADLDIDIATGHGYPLRKQKESSAYDVAGTAFLKRYGIRIPDTATKFPAKLEGGILRVNPDHFRP